MVTYMLKVRFGLLFAIFPLFLQDVYASSEDQRRIFESSAVSFTSHVDDTRTVAIATDSSASVTSLPNTPVRQVSVISSLPNRQTTESGITSGQVDTAQYVPAGGLNTYETFLQRYGSLSLPMDGQADGSSVGQVSPDTASACAGVDMPLRQGRKLKITDQEGNLLELIPRKKDQVMQEFRPFEVIQDLRFNEIKAAALKNFRPYATWDQLVEDGLHMFDHLADDVDIAYLQDVFDQHSNKEQKKMKRSFDNVHQDFSHLKIEVFSSLSDDDSGDEQDCSQANSFEQDGSNRIVQANAQRTSLGIVKQDEPPLHQSVGYVSAAGDLMSSPYRPADTLDERADDCKATQEGLLVFGSQHDQPNDDVEQIASQAQLKADRKAQKKIREQQARQKKQAELLAAQEQAKLQAQEVAQAKKQAEKELAARKIKEKAERDAMAKEELDMRCYVKAAKALLATRVTSPVSAVRINKSTKKNKKLVKSTQDASREEDELLADALSKVELQNRQIQEQTAYLEKEYQRNLELCQKGDDKDAFKVVATRVLSFYKQFHNQIVKLSGSKKAAPLDLYNSLIAIDNVLALDAYNAVQVFRPDIIKIQEIQGWQQQIRAVEKYRQCPSFLHHCARYFGYAYLIQELGFMPSGKNAISEEEAFDIFYGVVVPVYFGHYFNILKLFNSSDLSEKQKKSLLESKKISLLHALKCDHKGISTLCSSICFDNILPVVSASTVPSTLYTVFKNFNLDLLLKKNSFQNNVLFDFEKIYEVFRILPSSLVYSMNNEEKISLFHEIIEAKRNPFNRIGGLFQQVLYDSRPKVGIVAACFDMLLLCELSKTMKDEVKKFISSSIHFFTMYKALLFHKTMKDNRLVQETYEQVTDMICRIFSSKNSKLIGNIMNEPRSKALPLFKGLVDQIVAKIKKVNAYNPLSTSYDSSLEGKLVDVVLINELYHQVVIYGLVKDRFIQDEHLLKVAKFKSVAEAAFDIDGQLIDPNKAIAYLLQNCKKGQLFLYDAILFKGTIYKKLVEQGHDTLLVNFHAVLAGLYDLYKIKTDESSLEINKKIAIIHYIICGNGFKTASGEIVHNVSTDAEWKCFVSDELQRACLAGEINPFVQLSTAADVLIDSVLQGFRNVCFSCPPQAEKPEFFEPLDIDLSCDETLPSFAQELLDGLDDTKTDYNAQLVEFHMQEFKKHPHFLTMCHAAQCFTPEQQEAFAREQARMVLQFQDSLQEDAIDSQLNGRVDEITNGFIRLGLESDKEYIAERVVLYKQTDEFKALVASKGIMSEHDQDVLATNQVLLNIGMDKAAQEGSGHFA